MKIEDQERYRALLKATRLAILDNARKSLSQDMILDAADLSDEMDLASTSTLQSFELRLRSRERVLLSKVEASLRRIDDGSFGICIDCEEPISSKRLAARPEATLCMRCKESQERSERLYV